MSNLRFLCSLQTTVHLLCPAPPSQKATMRRPCLWVLEKLPSTSPPVGHMLIFVIWTCGFWPLNCFPKQLIWHHWQIMTRMQWAAHTSPTTKRRRMERTRRCATSGRQKRLPWIWSRILGFVPSCWGRSASASGPNCCVSSRTTSCW